MRIIFINISPTSTNSYNYRYFHTNIQLLVIGSSILSNIQLQFK